MNQESLKKTYTLTFDGITLDTSRLRMDKMGGKEVIEYFQLDESYRIQDEEIVDAATFREAVERSGECTIKSTDGDRTVIEVTLLVARPMKPMKLVQELADEYGVDSLYGIYRVLYKYTDCGPSIGFLVTNIPPGVEEFASRREKDKQGSPVWFYCDGLRSLGTFEDMKEKAQETVGISVSSIVEGSDAEVEGGRLFGDATIESFRNLVEEVNKEASFLWVRDNSDWYCIKSPDGEPWSVRETLGEIKWDDDDDKPPVEVVLAFEEFIKEGGNITWNENVGKQTHGYDEFFPLPRAEGWTVCQYLPLCDF
jgi:hypothetical protein